MNITQSTIYIVKGLKWLHAITKNGKYMLRVDLTGKDPSGDGQVTGFAKYTDFSIGPASGSYTLHVGGYLQNSTISKWGGAVVVVAVVVLVVAVVLVEAKVILPAKI